MRHAGLETVRVRVPQSAAPVYVAALEPGSLSLACYAAPSGMTEIEVVREKTTDGALMLAIALAEAASGVRVPLVRESTPDAGWLARVRASFSEGRIGRRFVVRPSHVRTPRPAGKITLVLDAGSAFGSGEHVSTRGVLLALERLAPRRPRAILDLGTGSGILAIAAAKLWRRPVLALDNDPYAVAAARANAATNAVAPYVRAGLSEGWRSPRIRQNYDLVLANIFARPLCRMARALAAHLSPGGHAVLAGFLRKQAPMVLAAHRSLGLVLCGRVTLEGWTTLILRRPSRCGASHLER